VSVPVATRPFAFGQRPDSAAAPAAKPKLVVGIGDFAVSSNPLDVIITHALGSCIAVCIWDPSTRATGLLHFLLPESKVNKERAGTQPATFADTGIPLLFQTAYALGLDKKRCRVRLVGGAETRGGERDSFNIGKRNLQAARNGVMVHSEATGGTAPRTVTIAIDDGRLQVSTGRDVSELK
jgi:chemotaxis protein CheD